MTYWELQQLHSDKQSCSLEQEQLEYLVKEKIIIDYYLENPLDIKIENVYSKLLKKELKDYLQAVIEIKQKIKYELLRNYN